MLNLLLRFTSLHILADVFPPKHPTFFRDSSVLRHNTTAAAAWWCEEPAYQGRVTAEVAGSDEVGLDSITRSRRGNIRTHQLLVVSRSMPGITTGEKMAKNMQHLEGQWVATGRASREAKYPVPKQLFPATLKISWTSPSHSYSCCTRRLTQTVVFYVFVLLDLGAASFQTDCSYSSPVFTALPSPEGTELHCQLYQGWHI